MSYKSFCSNLKSGDLLLFSGNAWYSRLIEYFSSSKYSHIGIVLKDEDKYYLLESGLEEYPDKKVFGVQLTDLEKIYDNCIVKKNSKLYIRKLVYEKDITENIKNAYQKVKDCPYDTDVCDWIWALLELKGDIPELKYDRVDKFWCSALATYILEKCELVDKKVPWTLIAPCDYSFGNEKTRIKFINECSYGAEEIVDEGWLLK